MAVDPDSGKAAADLISLDQVTDPVRHVSRPGKIGTVIVHA
jgi:hypothetical protein